MKSRSLIVLSAMAVLATAIVSSAQSQVSGLFFNEGWESGALGQTFNSQSYGNLGQSAQVSVDAATRAAGNYSLRHHLLGGTPVGGVHTATQHFGDARTGPVWASGQGQHFYDFYVQWKTRYSAGFDFGAGHYKQFMIGTQDERRHDEACCLPFAAHYVTVQVFSGGNLRAEAYHKGNASSPRIGFSVTPLNLQTGRWYTIEVRRRLNDEGIDNGIFQMWVDGVLVSDHRNVRMRVPFDGTFGTNFTYGTNFVHLNDYTTYPVSQTQDVHYDDVKFSTTYIGTTTQQDPPDPPTNLRIISS